MTTYGIVVYNFRGKQFFTSFVVLLVLISRYSFRSSVSTNHGAHRAEDNYASLILPVIASAGAVFFGRQYFDSVVVHDLVDAGRVDGAGDFGIFHQS